MKENVLRLDVLWSGPFTIDEVVTAFDDEGSPPLYDGEDYGLYQIYGTHILAGPDTLLYVGQATNQTFARRFRQHREWLIHEEGTSIHLGRVYNPSRHMAVDGWRTWLVDVRLAECILIYKYSPNYNSVSISDAPMLGSWSAVELTNKGQRRKLHARDLVPHDW
jgi:hypothetical protein